KNFKYLANSTLTISHFSNSVNNNYIFFGFINASNAANAASSYIQLINAKRSISFLNAAKFFINYIDILLLGDNKNATRNSIDI
ncbi:MAG TPA: hypothetical protein PK467_05620, partial [Candidatus Wallbacteria bacterium]|nr:hypothetical protein [Candidatus Wallbacteria bacterium]